MHRIKNWVRLDAAITAFALAIAGIASTASAQTNPQPITVPGSQPNIQLVAPPANGEWTMPAGDYGNTRFSPLDKINAGNVKTLHVVATAATGIPHGFEGQRLKRVLP
jgi:glucose dehydrogenase